MVPFGNFGWNLGFGFGWILIVISLLIMVAAIGVLAQTGKSRRARSHAGHRDPNAPPDVMRSGPRRRPRNPRG